MKEKLLALLLAAFAGVRKDGLNQLATALAPLANTEEEANTIVGNLTAEKVNAFVTDWRKDVDSEINKANRSYKDGLEKKYDLVEKKAEEEGHTPPSTGGSMDAEVIGKMITDAVTKATQPLQEKLSAFQTNELVATRRETLSKAVEALPQEFRTSYLTNFDRLNFKDEEDFTAHMDGVKADVGTLNQSLADKGLGQQAPPMFGKIDSSGVSVATQAYISAQKDEGKTLSGKEV